MDGVLLDEQGWEALANIRLRRLEEDNAENERLAALVAMTRKAIDDFPGYIDDWGWMLKHVEFFEAFSPEKWGPWLRENEQKQDTA